MPPDSLPYLRMHPRDFFCDIVHMTNEQAGAYARLYCMAWLGSPIGTLPDDDERLATIAGVHAMAWRGIKAAVMEPFRLIDGRWHHPHQTGEAGKAIAFSERQRANANMRWHGSGNAKPMPPSPSPSPVKSARASGTINLPPEAIEGMRQLAELKAQREERRRLARQNGAHP